MSGAMRFACLGLVGLLALGVPGCALWCDDGVVFFDSLFGYGPPPAPVVVAPPPPPPPAVVPSPPPVMAPYPPVAYYYDPWWPWPPFFLGFNWSVWHYDGHHRPPHWDHRPPPPPRPPRPSR